ncbi:hypothetical protein EV127DRAFT_492162 [Xylaria flabelliformis]|nr:hypothetical protein EV127DRAFT_492162 [Xylaria flabelliformis]
MDYSALYPHQEDPYAELDVQPQPHVETDKHFEVDKLSLPSSPVQQSRRSLSDAYDASYPVSASRHLEPSVPLPLRLSTSRSRLLPQQDRHSCGKPTVKKIIQPTHLLAAIVSLISLALSIIAVDNEALSWFLGQDTDQLIVVGFLLSIMNICLSTVVPMLFLLLEARFGQYKIQNYDSILRN